MYWCLATVRPSAKLTRPVSYSTFHFTFASDKPLDRHVLPRSYKQAMVSRRGPFFRRSHDELFLLLCPVPRLGLMLNVVARLVSLFARLTTHERLLSD